MNELTSAIRVACLSGPKVLAGLAPTQQQFNLWMGKLARELMWTNFRNLVKENRHKFVFDIARRDKLTSIDVETFFIPPPPELSNVLTFTRGKRHRIEGTEATGEFFLADPKFAYHEDYPIFSTIDSFSELENEPFRQPAFDQHGVATGKPLGDLLRDMSAIENQAKPSVKIPMSGPFGQFGYPRLDKKDMPLVIMQPRQFGKNYEEELRLSERIRDRGPVFVGLDPGNDPMSVAFLDALRKQPPVLITAKQLSDKHLKPEPNLSVSRAERRSKQPKQHGLKQSVSKVEVKTSALLKGLLNKAKDK